MSVMLCRTQTRRWSCHIADPLAPEKRH